MGRRRRRLIGVGYFIDVGGSISCGEQVFQPQGQEYVAASDRDIGPYILRYKGSA